MVALAERLPKRRDVTDFARIDDGQLVADGNLDQTKVGAISVFRDEFRVKADKRRIAQLVTEFLKMFITMDRLVLHERFGMRAAR